MTDQALEHILRIAQALVAILEPSPETRAIGVALTDAQRWQAARRAVAASAGGHEHPQGLAWEEV